MLITIRAFDGNDAAAIHTDPVMRCRQLEAGHILFFPCTPFDLPADDCEFLLSQEHPIAAAHKNIAYLPSEDRVSGCALRGAAARDRLRVILRAYSLQATRWITAFLPPYAATLRVDYASFRPEEEEGRRLRRRSRNDLLHIDAFPSRPTNGNRILRVFTNINPTCPRRWVTTDGFEVLLRRFSGSPPLRRTPRSHWAWRTRRAVINLARTTGLPVVRRSPYDELMLRFHNFLKGNREFQASCTRETLEFPPLSTWVALTDMVPHAALSGRYALEQTFVVAREALLTPEKAPINLLERLYGRPLTDPSLGLPQSGGALDSVQTA